MIEMPRSFMIALPILQIVVKPDVAAVIGWGISTMRSMLEGNVLDLAEKKLASRP